MFVFSLSLYLMYDVYLCNDEKLLCSSHIVYYNWFCYVLLNTHFKTVYCSQTGSHFVTGKTEITKMLVAQIARLSQWSGDYFLQERIIEVFSYAVHFNNIPFSSLDDRSVNDCLNSALKQNVDQFKGAVVKQWFIILKTTLLELCPFLTRISVISGYSLHSSINTACRL
jgi:hypothetical protein